LGKQQLVLEGKTYAPRCDSVPGHRPDLTPEVRQEISIYLSQIPASMRRLLRRGSDPTGKTVSADLVPQKPENLLRILRTKLTRFQADSSPLRGVDWRLVELLGVCGFGEVWKARTPHHLSSRGCGQSQNQCRAPRDPAYFADGLGESQAPGGDTRSTIFRPRGRGSSELSRWTEARRAAFRHFERTTTRHAVG
jgi:hypothetical protein